MIDIDAAVQQGKEEILRDIAAETVPTYVPNFSALHDYVDANEYAGLCNERADWSTEEAAAVQAALDAWLRRRALTLKRKTSYTLVEFFAELQRSESGIPFWEEPSLDVNGKLMVFYTVEDAVGMARFIMGCDGGDVRESRPDYAPLIGVLCHEYDAAHEDPEDPEAYSVGWVDIDGVFHEGDYENDPPYWQTRL